MLGKAQQIVLMETSRSLFLICGTACIQIANFHPTGLKLKQIGS